MSSVSSKKAIAFATSSRLVIGGRSGYSSLGSRLSALGSRLSALGSWLVTPGWAAPLARSRACSAGLRRSSPLPAPRRSCHLRPAYPLRARSARAAGPRCPGAGRRRAGCARAPRSRPSR
ncbi:MAG: hypothetical protein C0506_14430 [Anaerolinea sp.]|nr:hypothetical protein [Anaerolinea sp.]